MTVSRETKQQQRVREALREHAKRRGAADREEAAVREELGKLTRRAERVLGHGAIAEVVRLTGASRMSVNRAKKNGAPK